MNPQFVCFTGGLGPVRGRVAPCAPESVYIAFRHVLGGVIRLEVNAYPSKVLMRPIRLFRSFEETGKPRGFTWGHHPQKVFVPARCLVI